MIVNDMFVSFKIYKKYLFRLYSYIKLEYIM